MMELIGQENNIKYFENAIKNQMLHHCYLIHGTKGTGKKTFTKEIAKYILCGNWNCHCRTCTNIEKEVHPDVNFFYSEDAIVKLETVDQFKRAAIYSPLEGERKIVVLEGVDRLNTQGANKLLTLIEEPPLYLTIFLLCENITNVIRTIRSRAIPIKINSLTINDLKEFLCRQKELDPLKAEIIAVFSEGSMGKALEYLETDFWTIRENVYNLFLETSEKGLDYIKLNKTLANIEPALVLDLIEFLLRDLLYLKVGQNKDILVNKDYYDKINLLRTSNMTKIEEILNKVKIIRNTLKNNINPMLNFEVIYNSLQEE